MYKFLKGFTPAIEGLKSEYPKLSKTFLERENNMAKKKKAAKRKSAVKRRPAAKKKSAGRKKSGLTTMMYTVSPELQAVVMSKSLTRPQIVKKLWVYIKAHKCQDAKNRRMIVPDAKLAVILGKKPVDMLKLAGHLNKHIKK